VDATTAHSLLTHSHTEDHDGTPTDTAPETTAPTQTVGTEEHHKRPRRRLVIIAVVVLVLLAAGVGGGYLKYASQFVSTDNAQVDGDQVAINAPATGTLTGWQITQGTQVHTDQIVGRIQINSTGPQELTTASRLRRPTTSRGMRLSRGLALNQRIRGSSPRRRTTQTAGAPTAGPSPSGTTSSSMHERSRLRIGEVLDVL